MKTALNAGFYGADTMLGGALSKQLCRRPANAVAITTWGNRGYKERRSPRKGAMLSEGPLFVHPEVAKRAHALALASCLSECTRTPLQLECTPPLFRHAHAMSHTFLSRARGREARELGTYHKVLTSRVLPSGLLKLPAMSDNSDGGFLAPMRSGFLHQDQPSPSVQYPSLTRAMGRAFVPRALDRAAVKMIVTDNMVCEANAARYRGGSPTSCSLDPDPAAGNDRRSICKMMANQWLAQTGYGQRTASPRLHETELGLDFVRACYAWRRHETYTSGNVPVTHAPAGYDSLVKICAIKCIIFRP